VRLPLGPQFVNPNTPDTQNGQTPLSWAAWHGHEGIVKLLLGRPDVNPDSRCHSGQTPLLWAARKGHEGIVKLLLGRGNVNPNIPDPIYRRTPLLWAAENGHEGIVKLLLGREDVNPYRLDNSGQTSLGLATRNMHRRVVIMLQSRYSQRTR